MAPQQQLNNISTTRFNASTVNPSPGQDSQQLLKQILSLTDAEVASLAPEQRVHVEQIRSQVRRNAF